MSHTYDAPRPALTVDIVVLHGLYILLIQRGRDPFQGAWALPGGRVNEGERLVDAAVRELREETGLPLSHYDLTQIGAFGDPGRDPRGWTVSVAYLTRLTSPGGHPRVQGQDDAQDAQWWALASLPDLAFDHMDIIQEALFAAQRTPRP